VRVIASALPSSPSKQTMALLLLHGRRPPHVIVTDLLRSYGATMKVMGNIDKQETGRWLNNRAENSHTPFRRREQPMLRFRQMRTRKMQGA
jgi:transposase-like protein